VPAKSGSQTFYRWEDSQGRVHIASNLDGVPANERAGAARVELNGYDSLSHYAAPPRGLPRLDWPSFGLGFGLALIVALIFRFLPRGMRWTFRFAIVIAVATLLMGAYLAALRREAGLGDGSALASPTALVDDAKGAVKRMNDRLQQREEELRKIEAEGRGEPAK
jgi:hypothetical protein